MAELGKVDGGGGGHLLPLSGTAHERLLDKLHAELQEAVPAAPVGERTAKRLCQSAPKDFAALWGAVADEADNREAAARQNARDLETVGAHITVVHEIRVRCDSTLVTTVFQNLIVNAIKNRRRDRPLSIRIDGVREEAGCRISIEDNGVGFDPNFAAVALNPLARGVHTAGEGTGIGLATCRTIIQSHGGEIRIDPNWRNGARVEFTLPDKGES